MVKERTDDEKKEGKRKVALGNLKDEVLTSLAVAYLTENGEFGEAGKSAVEMYKYLPALNSDNGSQLQSSLLLGSRQDGKRYSGNFSEFQLIQKANTIMQESLLNLKVSDVLNLIGLDKPLKKNHIGKYVSEVDDKTKQEIIGHYQAYTTTKYVSEALKESLGGIKGGLEKVLCEQEKKK